MMTIDRRNVEEEEKEERKKERKKLMFSVRYGTKF